MLLRRVMEHVKAQNWTAVAIDFVIVVVGVFIGIQVSNWNEARTDRQIEAQHLVRLHQELSEMSAQAQAAFETAQGRFELIGEVRNYFKTGNGGESLGGPHCAAVARTHIYAGAIFYPPTIKELISTGRIALVRNDAIRTSILSFDQTNVEISQLREDIQIGRLLLARQYPNLIQLGLTEWEGARCNFVAMAAHQPFLNDFTDNGHRFSAYVDDVLGRQSEVINSLGSMLAANLGKSFAPIPDQTRDVNDGDSAT